MSDQSQNDERRRDLASFANASGQPNQPVPGGHALVRPTTGLAERVIGAQPVAVYRNDQKIMQQLASMAAFAGDDWFYRFPVKRRDGGQDWIEGPSIKLANNVARIFGNNVNEVREIDVGDAWIFYARFTDIETGFSMERAYRQRKSQTSMKMKDADRQLDIAYQIGQSKAIRNCIVNSLQVYADYAFEQARNSLIDKIGTDLPAWRQRTVEGIAKVPVDLNRVERTIGRSSREWLAPHVAQVIAMLKSIADGMATVDEVFPPLEAAATGPTASNTGSVQQAADGARDASSGNVGETTRESERPAAAEHPPSAAEDRPMNAAPDSITVAYERGKEARASGATRKALPAEYRDATHSRDALAWQAGFDGAPRPTSKQEG
jgi:hypothetical protein